ncbi:hypothetical protein MTO96_021686 [Rhipicephalus appendiculatus]
MLTATWCPSDFLHLSPGQSAPPDRLVFLGPKEKLAPKAQPDTQGAQDHKALRETVACRDFQDCKDPLDQEDLVAHR